MKPYQPIHQVPRHGLLKIALAAILGGTAIGGVAYVASLLFYLMILFPIGMSTAGGLLMGWAVRSGKVRHPLVASLFGLLMGFCIYGTMLGLGYWNVLNRATRSARQINPSLTFSAAVQEVNTELKQSTGLSGFPGFLKMEAQNGASIARIGQAGIHIGEIATWVYWLVELAIVQYLVAIKARTQAKAAFCPAANEWYGQPERCGNVQPDAADRFLELLNTDQFASAGVLINSQIKKVAAGSLEIYTQTAVGKGDRPGNVLCIVNSTAVGKNGRLTMQEVASGILAPIEWAELRTALSKAPDSLENLDNDEITYQEHDLDSDQIADIVQQLKNYAAIQAAYLLKISEIGGVPLTTTYQLGIIFDRKYITTDQDKSILLNELSNEMDTPGEAYVTLLNDDPISLQAIRQVIPHPVYHK